MSLVIRAAGLEDAAAVAALHTASWRVTYRGLLPDSYLDGALASEQAAQWAAKAQNLETGDVWLAAEEAGAVVGFVYATADPAIVAGTYVDNLHADPERRRSGVGRRLMGALAERLIAEGGQQAWLTVYPENTPAVRFYERLGGQAGLLIEDAVGGNSKPALTIYWRDLREMARAARA